MPTEEQYQHRIEALEARVRELTLQLERVTSELDTARRQLEQSAESAAAARENGGSEPVPGSVCGFCDGEGIYWVHDFEMVCRRCNGTGQVPSPSSTPAE